MSPRDGDAVLAGLLGPIGTAALGEALRALARALDGIEAASLRVAGWTAESWWFRFELTDDERQLIVHVPHDGRPAVVTDPGPGPDPFAPGGLLRPE